MTTLTVDEKAYALPMEVEPMAFYYSVAAWEEAGLTESDIPGTWEELLAIAERVTTDERFGVLFETIPGYYQNFTWYPSVWQGGGETVGPDGTSGFNSEGAIQALKFWQDAITMGVAPRQPLGTGANDIAASLGSGYCAMQNVGIWGISAFRDNAPDFEYGVFKLRNPPGGTSTTDLGGWAIVANSQGKDPETATQFCVSALGSMMRSRSNGSSIGAHRQRATCYRLPRQVRRHPRKGRLTRDQCRPLRRISSRVPGPSRECHPKSPRRFPM